ncbi:MAG TPA: hypothetical protein VMV42_00520 [archaeon]|nr:hypothetical protein [archaeon]
MKQSINWILQTDLAFDARLFVIGCILLAALAGAGGTIAALRGMRRLAILFLFVSVLYLTYFVWVLSLIPLALAGYLLYLPRKERELTWKTISLTILGATQNHFHE